MKDSLIKEVETKVSSRLWRRYRRFQKNLFIKRKVPNVTLKEARLWIKKNVLFGRTIMSYPEGETSALSLAELILDRTEAERQDILKSLYRHLRTLDKGDENREGLLLAIAVIELRSEDFYGP